MSDVEVRPADERHVAAINRIHNLLIEASHATFDMEPWTDDERREWFRERLAGGYPVLVAERSGEVIGAAWSGPWRRKAAYRSTVETTVIVGPGESGSGVGTALYRRLHRELVDAGFHMAVAVVALPNDRSVALHRKLGYREVGVLHEVGRKYGGFISTMLLEKRLTGSRDS